MVDFEAVAILQDDDRPSPRADGCVRCGMHIERTGNESIRRSAPAGGADAQLVLRNHRNGRRQTVRPDDDDADRGTEIDVPALRTIASNRDLTQHRSLSVAPCAMSAAGPVPGPSAVRVAHVWAFANRITTERGSTRWLVPRTSSACSHSP